MGLFDKKYCDVCGGKIGLLGNRKLSDGNMCKDCAARLSPWLSGRKQMTLADINAHLAYREQNAQLLSTFMETRVLGNYWTVHIDDNQGLLFVTNSRNWRQENPDVIRFDQITGCSVDVQQHVRVHDAPGPENPQGGPGGPQGRPGQPPMQGRPGQPGPGGGRYETYSYDFDIVVNVNSEWFNELRFRVNRSDVEDTNQAQYQSVSYEAEQIRDALNAVAQTNVANIAAANAPRTAVICPFCGASTIPDMNGCCEFCGGAIHE